VLCRACAALPQLVLGSSTAAAALYAASHCDAGSCCRRLQRVVSAVRRVAPLAVGLLLAAIAVGDRASGSWLQHACADNAHSGADYRLNTVLAAVCFVTSAAGAILVLSTHLALRRPAHNMAEPLHVPLMELNAAADDDAAARGRATSGDVTVAMTSCRISCETAPEASMSRHDDAEEFGSWRCFSKMGLSSCLVVLETAVWVLVLKHWSRLFSRPINN